MSEEATTGAGAPLTGVPVEVMVKHCALILKPRLHGISEPRGVAVGCGTGDEAVYVRWALAGSHVTGLDAENRFSAMARGEVDFLMGDAKALPFPAARFDFAFALHSLEHVGGAREALAEIARVLKPGAWFYMGVPNRTRLVGYLGSMEPTTLQKITWNLKDYSDRLRGRFTNELGAHAGFSWRELEKLLGEQFSQVECQTEALLRFKYGERLPRTLLNRILSPRLINYAAPSHYALCRKAS
ncbi:MAG: class I SAM-dependent methyltransferase [Terriglobia bacterium]